MSALSIAIRTRNAHDMTGPAIGDDRELGTNCAALELLDQLHAYTILDVSVQEIVIKADQPHITILTRTVEGRTTSGPSASLATIYEGRPLYRLVLMACWFTQATGKASDEAKATAAEILHAFKHPDLAPKELRLPLSVLANEALVS